MGSFFAEAIKGLQVELEQQPDWSSKLACLRKGLRILISEFIGTLSCIPYAITTMHLYKSLPAFQPGKAVRPSSAPLGVALRRDVQYSPGIPGPRTLLDVYCPVDSKSGTEGSGAGRPVIVFLHGGVWASGEKWHYAPMATRLAQEGYVVVVPTYELYPKALVPDMVKQVSDALGWCQDNIGAHGGDPARIALVGHSAGGHLGAVALLCRAAAAAAVTAAAAAAWGSAGGAKGGAAGPLPAGAASESGGLHGVNDPRMPALFVSMAGVYDIAKHFEFERTRGIEEMSMMKRAMNGFPGFAAMSPTVVIKHTLAAAATANNNKAGTATTAMAAGATAALSCQGSRLADAGVPVSVGQEQRPGVAVVYGEDGEESGYTDVSLGLQSTGSSDASLFPSSSATSSALAATSTVASRVTGVVREQHGQHWTSVLDCAGDAIPRRVGLFADLSHLLASWQQDGQQQGQQQGQQGQQLGADRSVALPAGALQTLPPTVVMASSVDHMVPWHESAEYSATLKAAGVPCKQLIYNHTKHSDYVLYWKPYARAPAPDRQAATAGVCVSRAADGSLLPGQASDLLKVLQVGLSSKSASRQQQQQQRDEGVEGQVWVQGELVPAGCVVAAASRGGADGAGAQRVVTVSAATATLRRADSGHMKCGPWRTVGRSSLPSRPVKSGGAAASRRTGGPASTRLV